jgi:hypothetical protein
VASSTIDKHLDLNEKVPNQLLWDRLAYVALLKEGKRIYIITKKRQLTYRKKLPTANCLIVLIVI